MNAATETKDNRTVTIITIAIPAIGRHRAATALYRVDFDGRTLRTDYRGTLGFIWEAIDGGATVDLSAARRLIRAHVKSMREDRVAY